MSTEAREATESVRHAVGQAFAAQRRLRGHMNAGGDELGYGQIRTISVLHQTGEMTAGEIARAVDLNPASVTALVDHLERAGLVLRRRSTEDRRVCHVALTEEGQEVAERKLAAWQARWEDGLAEFSDAELEAAARILGRVTEIFDAVGPRATAAAKP